MLRKYPLENGEVYHVMNKSIAGFQIFNSNDDYLRMKRMLRYFSIVGALPKFSQFLSFPKVQEEGFEKCLSELSKSKDRHVNIVAYCLMPTHLHLVLKQLRDNGVSIFVGNILNSYARYFNTKYKRTGPLWVGRFKNVPVESDEQLLHLTRYVHLNPVTAGLAEKVHEWAHTSYKEYVAAGQVQQKICRFETELEIDPVQYGLFVRDDALHQREAAVIKKMALD